MFRIINQYIYNKKMKKITLLSSVVIAAATLVGCGNSTPKASLKTDIDSLSYTSGMVSTRGLKQYLAGRLGVDTAYMADFIQGFNDGASATGNKKKEAYYAGVQIGQQVSNQLYPGINHQLFGNDSTESLSLDNMRAGFVAGVTGDESVMTLMQAQGVQKITEGKVRSRSIERRFGANREKGRKFLEEYAKNDSVKELADGVYYKVIKEGHGPVPADSARVKVLYEGRTIDGDVFESRMNAEKPATLVVRQLIKGWSEALTHMPVGSKWEIAIREDMAYGDKDSRKIEPYSTLIFTMELVGIEKEQPKKPQPKKPVHPAKGVDNVKATSKAAAEAPKE